jgi:hypothetical protein
MESSSFSKGCGSKGYVDVDVDVDWGRGYGATTLSHLGLLGTGPLCTAFSSARHLQRRFTSSDTRDLC